MLVLTRKPNQDIIIPGLGITVKVLRIDGGKVRIGIEAPPHVTLLRGELAEEDAAAAPPLRLRDRLLQRGRRQLQPVG